jgi:hypothetical protein
MWGRHQYRWRAAKFRPMLGAQGLWAGRDLYRVTRHGASAFLVSWTAPFCGLLRHATGCGGSILARILTGPHSVASYDTQGDVEDLFLLGSSRDLVLGKVHNKENHFLHVFTLEKSPSNCWLRWAIRFLDLLFLWCSFFIYIFNRRFQRLTLDPRFKSTYCTWWFVSQTLRMGLNVYQVY